MKTIQKILLLGFACAAGLDAAPVAAGPKGGRLLETAPLKAEFLVTADRRVEITFYDDHNKPVLPGAQVVAVTAEPAGGRVALEMDKAAAAFVSKAALPAGEPYRVVVQIRATPEAKPKNFRIDLNLSTCGGCKRAEYACTCEGH
jgi:hypothetical protein